VSAQAQLHTSQVLFLFFLRILFFFLMLSLPC
jgi:hypothetical protein